MENHKLVKVALIQRICPHYRVYIFRRLAKEVDLTLYYGQGQKTGAFQNAEVMKGFKSKKLFTLSFSLNLQTGSYYFSWFPSLLLHIIKDRPQVIVTEGATNILNDISVVFFAKITGTPFIWWSAGRNINLPKSIMRKIMEPILTLFIKQSSTCIAYGKMAKEYFLSKGVPDEKIFVADNTFDCEAVEETRGQYTTRLDGERARLSLTGKKVILYVGAFEKRRKLDNLLSVFKQLRSGYKDLALIMIGDGPEKDNIGQIIASDHIEDAHVLGRIVEGVGLYFMLCDVFVLPGWSSLAINQAMAYGKPVVTVAYGGPEYELIKNGENGFVVRQGDISGIKRNIEKIIFDDNLKLEMGQKGLRLIKEVTADNMINNIAKSIQFVSA